MIIYTNNCLNCFHRTRLREITSYCRKNKIELEIRQIPYNPTWQAEAKAIIESNEHITALPFIYHEGKATKLYQSLELE